MGTSSVIISLTHPACCIRRIHSEPLGVQDQEPNSAGCSQVCVRRSKHRRQLWARLKASSLCLLNESAETQRGGTCCTILLSESLFPAAPLSRSEVRRAAERVRRGGFGSGSYLCLVSNLRPTRVSCSKHECTNTTLAGRSLWLTCPMFL